MVLCDFGIVLKGTFGDISHDIFEDEVGMFFADGGSVILLRSKSSEFLFVDKDAKGSIPAINTYFLMSNFSPSMR